ncbi:MAG: signal peptidase II [Ruminococcaceae bacterium]|nr:signal peptidase II [Oscillospiraceae bacterium]
MRKKDKIIGTIVMLFMLAVDHLTKYWAIVSLKGQEPIKVWQNVFHFVYAENRGAAFSMLQNKRIFLILFTAAAIILVLWMIYFDKFKFNRAASIGLCLIASGGIGNLIDRIFRAYVVDFIYFVPINFPVFNVADACVTIGTIIFAIGFMVDEFRAAKSAKLSAAAETSVSEEVPQESSLPTSETEDR